MSKRVNTEEFVRTWQQAADFDALLAAVGSNRWAHIRRARRLRAAGVPLKFLSGEAGRDPVLLALAAQEALAE